MRNKNNDAILYNEIFLLIKACIDFWKGFLFSENKSLYLQKKDSLGYILMLIFTILLFIAIVYLIVRLFVDTTDIRPEATTTCSPVITEKTQTIPIDGKNIVCNIKIEVHLPKN